eukprot:scaffold83079_cov18-Prasinocladus_malaysianus.AAC.1
MLSVAIRKLSAIRQALPSASFVTVSSGSPPPPLATDVCSLGQTRKDMQEGYYINAWTQQSLMPAPA